MVCKIDFKVMEGDFSEANESAKNRWISQVYSVFMAKIYRQLTCEFDSAPIYFLPPMLYELETRFMGTKLLYAEPYISQDGASTTWSKYTNNYDFVHKQTMTAFTHFSHIRSQLIFMITDLQGVGTILSDPAIHSANRQLFNERTNLGDKGIKTFYASETHD